MAKQNSTARHGRVCCAVSHPVRACEAKKLPIYAAACVKLDQSGPTMTMTTVEKVRAGCFAGDAFRGIKICAAAQHPAAVSGQGGDGNVAARCPLVSVQFSEFRHFVCVVAV